MRIDDEFDEFSSEGDAGGAASRGVRVDQVLDRGVPIHWDEAVALLQEVVDLLVSTRHSELPVPAFSDIVIDPNGGVSLQGSGRGERGPLAAGRALHALLANTDVPIALRLFVTQANTQDTHASLRAFADGLAYFGKPGRADLIRTIYERYTGSSAAVVAAPASPRFTPAPAQTATPTEPAARRRRGPRWLAPVAVATCIVSFGAVIWLTVFDARGGQGNALLTSAKAAATATVTPVIKKTIATFSTPQMRTAEATNQSPSPTPPRGVRQARTAPMARTVVDLSRLHPRSAPALPLEPVRTPPPTEPESSQRRATAVGPFGDVSRERDEPLEIGAIYSHDDASVEPPVMLRPQLPPTLIVGESRADAVNRMELIVAPDGTVERVRLLNGPRRMADMMLLSGAKLWKFAPAIKDGEAVRYRTTVSWSGFP